MPNPFEHWTPEMVAAHNARVNQPNALADVATPANPAKLFPPTLDLVPQPSTDEEKLNKTERAYLWHLRKLNVPSLRVQQVTLKLAHDCRLTVDFTYVNADGRMVFVDVKGFQREDALIKMKVAARQFPEFHFLIVKREKSGWVEWPVPP